VDGAVAAELNGDDRRRRPAGVAKGCAGSDSPVLSDNNVDVEMVYEILGQSD